MLARLAVEVYFADPIERTDRVSQEAVHEALLQEDEGVLAESLIARHFALWRPLGAENLGERLQLGTRIQQLTRKIGDPELRLRGRVWHLPNLLEAGDLKGFDRELASFCRAAEELRLPVYLSLASTWRATRAMLRGDFERADALSEEARRIAEESHARVDIEPIARQSYGLQQYMLHRERGRLAAMESTVKATIEALPHIGGWHAGLAMLYIETGRPEDARRVFEQLAVDEFRAPAGGRSLAERDDDAGRRLRGPRRRRPSRAALRAHPAVRRVARRDRMGRRLPRIHRELPRPAATLQRFDDATAHFEDTLRAHRRLAAAPWVARTECHYAEALLACGGPADVRRAGQMAASAVAAARSLGMEELSGRAELLAARVQAQTRGERQATQTKGSRQVGTFRRHGEYWTVCLGDETVLLRDTKGLRYRAVLLRSPDREIHVLDLLAATDGISPERVPGAVSADAGLSGDGHGSPQGPDRLARAAYARRIEELETEIAEAHVRRESARAATLEGEQRLLAAELAQVYGIGRTRASPHVERARVAVTNSIRRAIRRMRRDAPVLARHFDRALTTGVFCSYAPADSERVSWWA